MTSVGDLGSDSGSDYAVDETPPSVKLRYTRDMLRLINRDKAKVEEKRERLVSCIAEVTDALMEIEALISSGDPTPVFMKRVADVLFKADPVKERDVVKEELRKLEQELVHLDEQYKTMMKQKTWLNSRMWSFKDMLAGPDGDGYEEVERIFVPQFEMTNLSEILSLQKYISEECPTIV